MPIFAMIFCQGFKEEKMKKILVVFAMFLLSFQVFAVEENSDIQACNYAKYVNSGEVWKEYLINYPDGACEFRAKQELKKRGIELPNDNSNVISQDQYDCNQAKAKNTLFAWKSYLQEHPNGVCHFNAKIRIAELEEEESEKNEAKTRELNNVKKAKKLQWSNRRGRKTSWYDADDYCENLTENGFQDWRVPTIDELRTTVINCQRVQSGGACKISEERDYLAEGDRDDNKCYCSSNHGGPYNKFGGDDWHDYWSSSEVYGNSSKAWVLSFVWGSVSITTNSKNERGTTNTMDIRCVREHIPGEKRLSEADIAYMERQKTLKNNAQKLARGRELVLEMCTEGKSEAAIRAITKLSETRCECEEDNKVQALKTKLLSQNGCNPIASTPYNRNTGSSFQVAIPPSNQNNHSWSSKSPYQMNWYDAVNYCRNLRENGYSDWRLPTISELRTTIINCPATQTGGFCRVSDSCLSYDCWGNLNGCSCGHRQSNDGYYSKFGDNNYVVLWSSSTRSDDTDRAWVVFFQSGWVENDSKSSNCNVRCVR